MDDAIISFVHSHLYPNKKNSAQQLYHAKMARSKQHKGKSSLSSGGSREGEVFRASLPDHELVFNGLSSGTSPVISAPLGLGEVGAAKKEAIMQLWEESWINL